MSKVQIFDAVPDEQHGTVKGRKRTAKEVRHSVAFIDLPGCQKIDTMVREIVFGVRSNEEDRKKNVESVCLPKDLLLSLFLELHLRIPLLILILISFASLSLDHFPCSCHHHVFGETESQRVRWSLPVVIY